MDRGDIGTLIGAIAGGTFAITAGFGHLGVAAATGGCAYFGHKLGGSCYSSRHSYK